MSGMFKLPLLMYTDSYKISHQMLYPDAKKMVAYAEFRKGYDGDETDTRILFYGIRHVVEQYVAVRWTEEDVRNADLFFRTHNAGNTAFKFPKDLFLKFIKENDGYFPVKIEALPEGTVVYPHVPVYQITAENEYSRLCTFLETVLTMVWYPTTVATLSRRVRDVIEVEYERTVDEKDFWSLNSRLHDFGFRGCTCLEQSIIGGAAHLVNFDGTDTLSAAYHVQFNLNNGRPVGTSIPATEHSVMMSFKTEREAILSMLKTYGEGVYAIVMDTFDYVKALEMVLPSVATVKNEAGGFLVIRPDSGDQVTTVLQALRSADKVFGTTTNGKGYKVLNRCGVIQGDGVGYPLVSKILAAVREAGYSAENVALGMGGGLLQKLNRDSMSFATKLSRLEYADGSSRDVFKYPKTEKTKVSLPGEFSVRRGTEKGSVLTVQSKNHGTAEPVLLDHFGVPEMGIKVSDPEAYAATALAAAAGNDAKQSLDAESFGVPEMGIKVANPDAYAAAALAADSDNGDENLLKVVYDHRPVLIGTASPSSSGRAWDSFDTIRERARTEWKDAPKTADVIGPELKTKAEEAVRAMRKALATEEEALKASISKR